MIDLNKKYRAEGRTIYYFEGKLSLEKQILLEKMLFFIFCEFLINSVFGFHPPLFLPSSF